MNKKQDKPGTSSNNTTLNISESLVSSPRGNSTRIINNTLGSTGVKRKPTSPLSSRTAMSKTSLGTICYNRSLDPQTYTDITSQGWTSRLVRYGGGSTPDESRTKPSAIRSAFIKTSPFPVIKLKKHINKPSPQRSVSLSSVRIAPPEKVIFQPNSRSNILRSGSMISMQNIGNANRNDNEPLNPASNELDATPTRSVLDALKEISRKRINNEELDAERIKKQCKDLSEVDSPPAFQNTLSDFGGGMSDLMYRSALIQKRPRESGAQQGQISPQSAELEKQKKRLCTKNNEVLSSLSSSIPQNTPKRQGGELNTRKGLDLNKESEETPSPQTQIRGGVIKEVPQSNLVVQVPVRKEVPSVPSVMPTSVIPKLTLFNKKFTGKPEEIEQNLLETESYEKKIRFVKPKDTDEELENQIKNIKKVEQSKLAVLLQCLAGELDEDEGEDMVDKGKSEEKIETPTEDTLKLPEVPKQPPTIQIPTQFVTTSISNDKDEKSKKENESSQKLEKPVVSFNLPQPTKSTEEVTQPAPAKPTFSFGIATTSSIIATPAVSNSISVIASTASTALVSSPPTTTTNEIPASNASFLFGNISNTDGLAKPILPVPTSAFTPTPVQLQQTQKPSFTFGTTNTQLNLVPPTNTINTTNTVTNVSQPPKIETSFVFGGSSAGNNENKPALPAFSSSSVATGPVLTPAPVVSSGFSIPSATPSLFGGFEPNKSPIVSQATTQASITAPVFKPSVITSNASPQISLFGSQSITTSATSIFGSSGGISTTSVFGQTGQKTENSTTTTFSTPSVTSTFNFGTKPTPSTVTFGQTSIFGQNIGNNSTETTNANQPSGGFSFKSPTTNQNQGNTGGFSFNQSGTSSQGINEPQKSSVFSRLGPTSSTSATTTTATQQNVSSVVSPSKSLFTFTSPTQGNSMGASNQSSVFGTNITNVSNISQTSSIFGGSTTMNSSTAQSTSNIFGNATTNNTTGINLFGQNTTQQQKDGPSGIEQILSAPATSNPPVFQSGFSSGQKAAFTFGSNSNNNNNNNNATPNPASTPFTFGQSTAQSPENKPFTFGAGNTTAPPAYPGSLSTQEPPKFNFASQGTNSSFGGSNNNNTNPQATPTFGSSGITPSPSAFNFNASSNNNVFGSGDASTGSSTGTFNFSATPAPVAPQAQGGLSFNIGTGGAQQMQGRRQIRTATRRLNK